MPLPLQVPQEKQLTELCMTVVFSGSIFPGVYRPVVLFENTCIENKLSPRRAASVPEIADISASSATQCFLPESPARARGGKPLKKNSPKSIFSIFKNISIEISILLMLGASICFEIAPLGGGACKATSRFSDDYLYLNPRPRLPCLFRR